MKTGVIVLIVVVLALVLGGCEFVSERATSLRWRKRPSPDSGARWMPTCSAGPI